MKHIVFLTLIFFSLSQNISAQKADVHFGLSTGVTLNNVYEHIEGSKFQWRLSPRLYSAHLSYTKNNRIGFKAELEYVEKGPRNFQISYINLAPMMRFIFPEKGNSFSAGPYFGGLIQYKKDGEVQNFRSIRNFDAGIQIDYQKDFSFGKATAYISPQFELGIFRFSNSKHISAQLKFGFIF